MKNLKLVAFIALALVQLYIPARMIWGQEEILMEGKAFKFKTAPVDPNDPFRGKYIRLTYEADNWKTNQDKDWKRGETVFVQIENDENGFVKIVDVTHSEPDAKMDYVKALVRRFYKNKHTLTNTLYISYPFDRFYMEESKALPAEKAYREARRDTSQIAYGLVYIKNGDAVLEDVILNGVPIQEVVEKEMEWENR